MVLDEASHVLIQQFEASDWIDHGGRELDEARDMVNHLRSSHRVLPASQDLARSKVEAARRAVEDALSRQAVREAVGRDDRPDRNDQLLREHQVHEEERARREREDRSREHARQEQRSAAAENPRRQQEDSDLTIAQILQDEYRLEHSEAVEDEEAMRRRRRQRLGAQREGERQQEWRQQRGRVAQLERTGCPIRASPVSRGLRIRFWSVSGKPSLPERSSWTSDWTAIAPTSWILVLKGSTADRHTLKDWSRPGK
ncbi:hypothetical protein BKA63DRAFT_600246 [Paraphoma chrysanthemicola]|nr:hypothetical protein BKA63DRAFT_600246 [Paraphoma chrysanthemicola]